MHNMNYDVIIIGGGAAGYAAASFLSEKKVLIIEKNREPMKKLAITGKGRCNLTNNCDVETLLRNTLKNAAFMRSALTRFTPADTISFFESAGVPLKTERGGRVFPLSDRASDIAECLRTQARLRRVTIVTDTAVALVANDGALQVKTQSGAQYAATAVVVATGGMSYPHTGSTGDGYRLAKQAGHTVTPLTPALVPLETMEDTSDLAGLSLKNVKLTLRQNNKTLFSEMGEMLFTHFGVSGPLVLSASCYLPLMDSADNSPKATLSIDLKPALDEKTLDARILRDFAQNKNRQFKNSLSALLPEKLIPTFVKRTEIPPDKKVNEITKAERRRLMLLKDFPLTVKAARPIDEAVITAGGVDVKQVNPKTMQSRLMPGLYFVGEVLDVHGFTGGFNLQLAWSTANAAATAINED